jgi:outer membrane receptor protein involved in Fe transport
MPLLADKPLAKLVQLNAAGRRTNYNTKDDLVASNPPTKVSVTTWKFAAVWDTHDWLRIRGSYSQDLRAAGFRELYYSQSIPADPPGTFFGFGGVTNPWLPAPFNYDPAVVNLSGNSSLKPEKAKTTTVGFVLSPKGWADSLHFSADWYQIKLINGISGGIIAKTVNACYLGDAFYCSQIEGTPGGPGTTTAGPDGSYGFSDITGLRAPYENGRPYKAEGVDMTADYMLPLTRLSANAQGSLMFRATATRALKTELETLIYPNWTTRNVVGQVGPAGFLADYAPTPKWVGDFSVTYLRGPATVTLQSRWTGAGKLNNEAPFTGPGDPGYDPNVVGSVDNNHVGNYFNFNLNASYDVKWEGFETSQFFLSVSNLFDRDPPYSSGSTFGIGGIGGVNGVFYDTLGRSYRIGMRVKF